jgi:hypothetical protein
MNILLWFLQIVIAFFVISGSLWPVANYAAMAKDIPSVQALPFAAWCLFGGLGIVLSLGLIVPALFKNRRWVFLSAVGLVFENLVLSVVHLFFYGFKMEAKNPAMWTLAIALLSAFVAFGRRKKPQDL